MNGMQSDLVLDQLQFYKVELQVSILSIYTAQAGNVTVREKELCGDRYQLQQNMWAGSSTLTQENDAFGRSGN
jgi:hypothetical protein